jgi:hypothetical protein
MYQSDNLSILHPPVSTEFFVSFYLYILCGVSLRSISDLTDAFVSVLFPDGLL